MSLTRRLAAVAPLAVAVVLAIPVVARAARADVIVRAAQHIAADPVGQYEWSLSMGDTPVSGTLAITRKDSTLAATLTSDHTQGEMTAKSVKQQGDVVTVVTEGEFGTFTVVIDFSKAEPTATFQFSSPQGDSANGPVEFKRVK